MPGNTSPTPITPTRQIQNPPSSLGSSRGGAIQRSPHAQYLAPTGSSRSQQVPFADTVHIRRAGITLTDHELAGLFKAVKADDAQEMVTRLQGLHDPNVKDPETGETLVPAAAHARAWRVIEALATEPSLAHVVDEPVNHERALAVAMLHVLFDPVLLSKWHRLTDHVDGYEGRLAGRIEGRAKKFFRQALSPVRRPPQDDQPVRLAEPKILNEQLRALIDRVDDLLIKNSKKLIDQADDLITKNPKEFADLDLSDSGTRAKFEEMMKRESGVLQKLRPELDRWDNFFRALTVIASRPLRDSNANSATIHDQATFDQDGDANLLIESLNARQGLDPNTKAPDTAAALNKIMVETTGSGTTVRMTQQQVLLAKNFFEQLPDHLLLDKGSLIRDVKAALNAADKAHGGRQALLQVIDAAVGKADVLYSKAAELRLQARNTRPKGADTRPEAGVLRREADKVAKEAEAKRREAQQEDFGAVGAPLRQLNDQVEALFKPAFDMLPAEDDASPEAAELRRQSDELLKQTQAQAQALTVPVSNYRTLKLYVALEKRESRDLEVHPRHLMAACLCLARQYTGRRDNADKSMNIRGDEAMVAKLAHAQRRIMAELDFRLAKHLVGKDEQGHSLPDTLLYRAAGDEMARGASNRSPTSQRHNRKVSDSTPLLGRLFSSST